MVFPRRFHRALSILGCSCAIACKAIGTNSGIKDAAPDQSSTGGGCHVRDFQTGQTADLTNDQSPFSTAILNNANVKFTPSNGSDPSCPTTIQEVLSAFDPKQRQVMMVDEVGDLSKADQSDGHHRFIVAQRLPGAQLPDIYFAPLESGPGVLDISELEVIAFDPARGAAVFYKFQNGQWNLMGNGTQIDPQKSQDVTASDGSFFCQSCHPTGALNFKERIAPWVNWAQGNFPDAHGFMASTDHLLNAWAHNSNCSDGDGSSDQPPCGDPSLPNEPSLTGPYDLEGTIEAFNRRLVAGRVSHVLAGDVAGAFPGQSLKTLMREVMCDVGEVNLSSSLSGSRIPNNGGSQGNVVVDPNLFLASDLMTTGQQGNLRQISFPVSQYQAAVAGQSIPDIPGARDAMAAFFGPSRSFISMAVGKALVEAGWLTSETLSDVLMTDFPNPIFSAQRCGLAATIPDVPAGTTATDANNGAAAFVNRWIASLNQASSPGAKGLANRLAASGQQALNQLRADAYVARCQARLATDPARFVGDLVRLTQQRREELRADPHLNRGNQGFPQIIESPDLFPVLANAPAPGLLHLQEDCTLGTAAPVIE